MLLQAISILPMSVSIGTADSVMFLISHEFTTFVVSTILWFSAPRLLKIMVKDTTSTSKQAESLTSYQVEALIFLPIGVILVTVSIPALANMVAYNIAIDTLSTDATTKAQIIASSKGFTTRYIAKLLVGIFLIFYSHKLCHLVAKVRKK